MRRLLNDRMKICRYVGLFNPLMSSWRKSNYNYRFAPQTVKLANSSAPRSCPNQGKDARPGHYMIWLPILASSVIAWTKDDDWSTRKSRWTITLTWCARDDVSIVTKNRRIQTSLARLRIKLPASFGPYQVQKNETEFVEFIRYYYYTFDWK